MSPQPPSTPSASEVGMRRDTLPVFASSIALVLIACTDNPPPSSPNRSAIPIRSSTVVSNEEQLDVPLAGLTAAELDRFNRGRAVFARVFTTSNGLGPSF